MAREKASSTSSPGRPSSLPDPPTVKGYDDLVDEIHQHAWEIRDRMAQIARYHGHLANPAWLDHHAENIRGLVASTAKEASE